MASPEEWAVSPTRRRHPRTLGQVHASITGQGVIGDALLEDQLTLGVDHGEVVMVLSPVDATEQFHVYPPPGCAVLTLVTGPSWMRSAPLTRLYGLPSDELFAILA